MLSDLENRSLQQRIKKTLNKNKAANHCQSFGHPTVVCLAMYNRLANHSAVLADGTRMPIRRPRSVGRDAPSPEIHGQPAETIDGTLEDLAVRKKNDLHFLLWTFDTFIFYHFLMNRYEQCSHRKNLGFKI